VDQGLDWVRSQVPVWKERLANDLGAGLHRVGSTRGLQLMLELAKLWVRLQIWIATDAIPQAARHRDTDRGRIVQRDYERAGQPGGAAPGPGYKQETANISIDVAGVHLGPGSGEPKEHKAGGGPVVSGPSLHGGRERPGDLRSRHLRNHPPQRLTAGVAG